MTTMIGAEVAARVLRQNGISDLFDLPGDPIGRILSAARADGVQTYSFRHEQASALAAQAYSFVSARLGVAVVASGPAMTNAITALATASANGWPMLLIGGASESTRRGMGDFQETPQLEAAAPLCKWSVAIDNPRRIPWFINSAIRKATSGRPGPVYLDFPADVINAEVDEDLVEWLAPVGLPPAIAADDHAIASALTLIANAERPLLLLGELAATQDAAESARAFVDKLQIPFVPAPMAKGVVPDNHPLCVSAARTYALQNADLVIAAGARFNWMFHFGRPPRFSHDVKVIEVSPVAEDVGESVSPTVTLIGDIKTVMRQLADAADGASRRLESAWIQCLDDERAKNSDAVTSMLTSDNPFTNFYRLFHELNQVLPSDVIVAADGESTQAVSRNIQQHTEPRHRLDAGPSGCMGVAVPYAIGAKIAAPTKQVVCLNGDYAFGWNGIEIETAVRYSLPILFVVANNGSIRPGQQAFHMSDYTGADAVRYDLMMEAFGGHGEFVTDSHDLQSALNRALNSRMPSLVNVVIDPNAQRKSQQFSWLDRSGTMQYVS